LITRDGALVEPTLKEAESVGYGWIFTSPVVESGLSLTSPKYTFTAVIKNGCPKVQMPIDCGMQALHRVRNLSAIRVVCLLGVDKQPAITEERLVTNYLMATDTLYEYMKYTHVDGKPSASFFKGIKEAAYSIYAHQSYITSLQNNDAIAVWIEKLEGSGYTVIRKESISRKLMLQPDTSLADTNVEYSFLYNEQAYFDSLKMNEERFAEAYPNEFNTNRYNILRTFGVDKANNYTAVNRDYWKYFNKARFRYWVGVNQFSMEQGALFYDELKAKVSLFGIILKETIGLDWMYYGSPMKLAHFEVKNADIYNHLMFSKLKTLCCFTDTTDERWFWYLAKDYGFTTKRFGKNNTKRKIANNINLRVNFGDVKNQLLLKRFDDYSVEEKNKIIAFGRELCEEHQSRLAISSAK
jgi:hypothetical protein